MRVGNRGGCSSRLPMHVGSMVLEAFPSEVSMYVGTRGGALLRGYHVSGK